MKIAISYLDPQTKRPVAWCVGDLDQLPAIRQNARALLYQYCGRTGLNPAAFERVSSTSTGQRIELGES